MTIYKILEAILSFAGLALIFCFGWIKGYYACKREQERFNGFPETLNDTK